MENQQELDPEFVKQLRRAAKTGRDAEKIEVLKKATELLSDRNSEVSHNLPFVNLCVSFLMFGGDTEPITSERIEVAIVHTKFLTALIRCAPKKAVQQHAVISGFISDIFGILYLARSSKTFLNDPICDELEHRLKALCKEALEDEGLKDDIPMIISNNLKAERRPSIAMLVCVSGCTREQIALLTTNLPTKEKQFFSQLLQRVESQK
ncbi:hypothetical protein M3Y97_00413200 [Aphelenchoides bicaudatus]|nr:hypothetical protein M3Y97_00413200 [Aphelenchoides bicaudatus]